MKSACVGLKTLCVKPVNPYNNPKPSGVVRPA